MISSFLALALIFSACAFTEPTVAPPKTEVFKEKLADDKWIVAYRQYRRGDDPKNFRDVSYSVSVECAGEPPIERLSEGFEDPHAFEDQCQPDLVIVGLQITKDDTLVVFHLRRSSNEYTAAVIPTSNIEGEKVLDSRQVGLNAAMKSADRRLCKGIEFGKEFHATACGSLADGDLSVTLADSQSQKKTWKLGRSQDGFNYGWEAAATASPTTAGTVKKG